MDDNVHFSLLYPENSTKTCFNMEEQAQEDLELGILVRSMTDSKEFNQAHYENVKNILFQVCTDEETIRYRQDISECLFEYPELMAAFEKLVLVIDTMDQYRTVKIQAQDIMYKTVFRLMELENYILCIDYLKSAFEAIVQKTGKEKLPSEGLNSIFEYIKKIYQNENFIHLKKNLPQLAFQVRNVKSITIGINVTDSLLPFDAAIISINDKPVTNHSNSIFSKMFNPVSGDIQGITPLRPGYTNSSSQNTDPLFKALLNDLASAMEKTFEPILKALNRYIDMNTLYFILLKNDLLFYIYSMRFILKLRDSGLPVCKPKICAGSDRVMEIENNYNMNLFIQMSKREDIQNIKNNLITNTVRFNDDGRIMILTGPNHGGKTVYTQAIGLSQLFFQAGLYVPGTKARISPADVIFTHFQIEETIANDSGRFADEAKRLNRILSQVTSRSLILMNESFTSTNYTESLYIAQDIMKIFRMIGLRVLFATHFHDLAKQVEEINRHSEGESKLISMVSMVQTDGRLDKDIKRTYKIVPSFPMGKSYAMETAEKYGIGYEQLIKELQGRSIISGILLKNSSIK